MTATHDYQVDTTAPTLTISAADLKLAAGESTTITFSFNEPVSGFSQGDVIVVGGSLSAITPDATGQTWTATFTPDGSGTAPSISVATGSYSDVAGNPGTGDTLNAADGFGVDLVAPVVTVNDSNTNDSTPALGGTVNDPTAIVVVEVDGVEYPATNNGDGTWSLADNVLPPLLDGSYPVKVTATDPAGNSSTDTGSLTVDTLAPTLNISAADLQLSAGEMTEITFTFSEPVNGFTISDVTITGGNLSGLVGDITGTVWTATFTQNGTDAPSISVSSGSYTDVSGNPGVGDTLDIIDGFIVDLVPPTLDITTNNSSVLSVGETALVTFTFNEEIDAATFLESDIAVEGGSLSGFMQVSATVWTAIFTKDATDTLPSVSVPDNSYSDLAGNQGMGDSQMWDADVIAPTLVISAADPALSFGDNTIITFKFSEPVTSFIRSDVVVVGGTLSNVSTLDNQTWTATFAPDGLAAPSISVADYTYSDFAGNLGTGDTLDSEDGFIFAVMDEGLLTSQSTVKLSSHLTESYVDVNLVAPVAVLSSGGEPIEWELSLNGKTLIGSTAGNNEVLRVVLTSTNDTFGNTVWNYDVTLSDSIDHLVDSTIENITFGLELSGVPLSETIRIDILDDVPVLAENVSYDFGSTPSIYFGNAVETFGADGGHLSTVTINGVTYTYDSVTDSISFAGSTTQFNPDSYSYENGVLNLTTYFGDVITVNFQTGEYSVESTGVSAGPAPDQVAPTAMVADQGGLLGTVGLNALDLIDLTANQKFTVADADNDITSTSLSLTTNLGDALVNVLNITIIPGVLVLPLGDAIALIGLDAVLNLLGGTVGGLLNLLGLASYGLEASQALATELGLKIIIGDQAFMPNPDGSGDYVYGQTITFELLDPSKPVSSQAFNELLASITVDQAFLGDVADLSLAPTYTLNVADSLSQTDMAQSIDIANVSLLGNLLGSNTTRFLTEGTAADESIDKSSTTTSQRIYGYEGNDSLTGGSGNDLIRGGTGNDTIIAGNGNDLIYGGSGNDTLTGNDGTDVFVWEDGDQGTTTIPAVDRITDFNQASAAIGGDVLDLSALLAGAGKIGDLAGNLANYLHFETVAGQTEIWISTSGAFTGGYNSAQDSSNIDQKIILEGVNYSANTRTDAEIINELLAKGKLIVDSLYGTPATKESITIDFTAIDNDSDVATKQSDGTATSTGSFDSIAVQPESDLVDPAINTDPVAIFADRALLELVGLGALGIDLDRQVYAAYDAENNIQKVEITYRPLIEVGLTKISIDASQRLAQELGLKLSYASTEGTLTLLGYSYTLTVTALDGGPIDNVKLNELLATVELTNENGTLLESSTLSLEVLQSMSVTVTDTNGKVDTDLGGSLLDANLINNLGDFNQFIIEGTNIDNTLDASGKLTGQRIYAYDGVDTITGSTHDDWIRAGAGVDTVNAGSGNDAIFGGLGNDILNGQDGNDLLFGESGNDTITGGIGSDIAVFQVLDGEERDATGGNGTDTWTDFIVDDTTNPEADMIDISVLLVDYAGDGSAASLADYLSVTSDGTDTTISIDRDGTGSQYQSADILVLRGVDTSLTELVNNNQFII
ncbi:Ig-like domain-containing protein [Acinetobacter sp. SA01]|uniref:Ig-like domain-containing protein n=2 Tax=Acinetobacter sp. SA01 TaxID=1862567 RepID=UPI003211E95A